LSVNHKSTTVGNQQADKDFQKAVSILQTIISKNGFGVIGQNTFPELDENNNVEDHISNGLILVTGLSKFANTWVLIMELRFSQNFWRTLLMGCTVYKKHVSN